MSVATTRLLVLGVTKIRQPTYGYQIQQELIRWHADEWSGITRPSVYNQLRTLTHDGFTAVSSTEKKGTYPSRTLYHVTPAGDDEFGRLLHDTLYNDEPHEFDLLPALCFIPFLTKEEIIGGITRREVGLRICLDEFTAGIDQIRAGSEGSHLFIQENFLLPKAEFESQLRWCEEFLERVKADQYELAEKSCWPGPLEDAKTEPRPSD